MNNITVGQIVAFVLALSAFAGAVAGLIALLNKVHNNVVKKTILDPINQNINQLREEMNNSMYDIKGDIRDLDISECRNFLVRFLGDLERDTDIDPVEIQRAYDVKKHYMDDLNQNSYVKDRWNAVIGDKSLAIAVKRYSKTISKE